MELKKIKYKSAVFFGAIGLLATFLIGLLKFILSKQDPALAASLFGTFTGVTNELIIVPLFTALNAYIYVIVAIFIYNIVARTYPISWDIKK